MHTRYACHGVRRELTRSRRRRPSRATWRARRPRHLAILAVSSRVLLSSSSRVVLLSEVHRGSKPRASFLFPPLRRAPRVRQRARGGEAGDDETQPHVTRESSRAERSKPPQAHGVLFPRRARVTTPLVPVPDPGRRARAGPGGEHVVRVHHGVECLAARPVAPRVGMTREKRSSLRGRQLLLGVRVSPRGVEPQLPKARLSRVRQTLGRRSHTTRTSITLPRARERSDVNLTRATSSDESWSDGVGKIHRRVA